MSETQTAMLLTPAPAEDIVSPCQGMATAAAAVLGGAAACLAQQPRKHRAIQPAAAYASARSGGVVTAEHAATLRDRGVVACRAGTSGWRASARGSVCVVILH